MREEFTQRLQSGVTRASGNVLIIRAARPHFGDCAGDLVCGKPNRIVEDGRQSLRV
jgi:hypothetical protein